MSEVTPQTLTELTVTLLASYTQNNTVRSDDLPNLILATHAALITTAERSAAPVVEVVSSERAVSVAKSLASRKFIISMIDGKPYKALKRHLTAQGITPEQYRKRYNLASDYPMVAPEYSESRRAFAMNVGLGRSRSDLKDGSPPAAPSGSKKAAAGGAPRADPSEGKRRSRTSPA